jgi:FAD/FMN-containing dehydrogenase
VIKSTLDNIVGVDNVLIPTNSAYQQYSQEQRGRFDSKPSFIVLPNSTEQVSQLLKYCYSNDIIAIPQGGNTGLVGGSVADYADRTCIIINLSRYQQIDDIYDDPHRIIVASGCTLAKLNRYTTRRYNTLWPVGLSVADKAQIGGIISTNAGGVNVLQHGMAGANVLGLEVVLANGEVVNTLTPLTKRNNGYNITSLFIGSEGTLGIITKASLKLTPISKYKQLMWVGMADLSEVITLYKLLYQQYSQQLTAFEVMSHITVELVAKWRQLQQPLANNHQWYLLIEFSSNMRLDLPDIANSILCDDINATTIWQIRSEIPWVQREEGASIKHDIALPLAHIAKFHAKAESKITKLISGARLTPFGHIGDGNLHYNVLQPVAMSKSRFLAKTKLCNQLVYETVWQYGGTCSAEHGVGLIKQDAMSYEHGQTNLQLMRAIKTTLDDKNIMNTGKVLMI